MTVVIDSISGAVIIFTGLLSVGMLGYKFQPFKWGGIVFVTLGLVVVGVTDILYDDNPADDTNAIITGFHILLSFLYKYLIKFSFNLVLGVDL